jgi:hypothetical protein
MKKKLKSLWPVVSRGLFASLNSLVGRIEWSIFDWLIGRVPIRVVKPSRCESFVVKVDLDLGDHEQEMHVISLPVDLLEYPDVLRARSLSVRLEMVGGVGTSATMREVRMIAGPDRTLNHVPCSDGVPAYRRDRDHHRTSKSQNTHPQPRPLPGT